jgi:hypothetical protein
MNNSIETLKKSYVMHNRLRDGDAAHAALQKALEAQVNEAQVMTSSSSSSSTSSSSSSTSSIGLQQLRFQAAAGRAKQANVGGTKRTRMPWTSDEEEALQQGVARHGEGAWAIILKDAITGVVLVNRNNVDLKDKWRCVKRKTG